MTSAISVPRSVSTWTALRDPAALVGQPSGRSPNASWPLARDAARSGARSSSGPRRQERADGRRGRGTRPRCGGIENAASSASMRDDGVGVAALPGVDVPLDELAHRARRRACAASPAGSRSGRSSSTALRARCSALLTEATRRLQGVGHLGGREAQHLAQDQHRPLARRQPLQRRDERQLDALALLVAGLRRGVAVVQPELLVGVRARATPSRPAASRDRRAGRRTGP